MRGVQHPWIPLAPTLELSSRRSHENQHGRRGNWSRIFNSRDGGSHPDNTGISGWATRGIPLGNQCHTSWLFHWRRWYLQERSHILTTWFGRRWRAHGSRTFDLLIDNLLCGRNCGIQTSVLNWSNRECNVGDKQNSKKKHRNHNLHYTKPTLGNTHFSDGWFSKVGRNLFTCPTYALLRWRDWFWGAIRWTPQSPS